MSTNFYSPTNPNPFFVDKSFAFLRKGQSYYAEAKSYGYLPSNLNKILDQIQSQTICSVISYLFTETTQQLNYLSFIETKLSQPNSRAVLLRTFSIVKKQTQSLLEYIENHVMKTEDLPDELRDALDFVSFALSHELSVAFSEVNNFDKDADSNDMRKACGQLINCFQQVTVTLAKVFNPHISLPDIFEAVFTKREQSLDLYNDLNIILILLCEFEESFSPSDIDGFKVELETFRQGTMKYLYEIDREQCQSFITKISLATDTSKKKKLLHQMKCYFETLLRHVRQRSVLAELQANNVTLSVIELTDSRLP